MMPHVTKASLRPQFPPSARGHRELGFGISLTALFAGVVLHTLGKVGQFVALLAFLFVAAWLVNSAIKGKRISYKTALIFAVLVNGETFIRDFAMRGLPTGYLAVEYLVILLGLTSVPSLLTRDRRVVASAPIILLGCICVWDSFGLFYSQDLWMGRVTTALHFAGLACFLLGAVSFSREETRRGLLDGIILGAFLSLGVMLRQTAKASYGMDLGSDFRFGHALVSAVQVGIVLTSAMLACLIKLINGYGKTRDTLLSLALLAPFCIATFSRGPLAAFSIAALCLSFCGLRSKGWWKLPAAGFLLAGAIYLVMCALPENFDNRYRELQGKDERGRIWAVVGEMWKHSPIVGYGPGSWYIVYPRFASQADRAPDRVSDAHNFLFQAASDGGIIGVSLFVLFLLAILYRVVRTKSFIGLGLFVFVLVNASLANFKLSVLFLLLGAGFGECLALRRPSGPRRLAGKVRQQWIPFPTTPRPVPAIGSPDAPRAHLPFQG